MPEDVLTQLGVNLPPLPEGKEGVVNAKPVTESMEVPKMDSIKMIKNMTVAGILSGIEQIILPYYGTTTEEGKGWLKIVRMIEKIEPKEELEKARSNIEAVIGNMMNLQQMPTITATPTATTQTTPTAGGTT